MEPLRSNLNASLVQELEKAEEAHLKDCPEADFSMRLAALLVDGILTYVALTGVRSVCQALGVFLDHVGNTSWSSYLNLKTVELLTENSVRIASLSEITLKILFIYIYFIISTSVSGGTPGKLLLGLRTLDSQTGKKIGPMRALARYLTAIGVSLASLGLVYFAALVKKDKKAYHDKLMGTSVKKVHGVR